MSSQTAVFRRIVRDHMGRAPVTVGPDTGCADLIARMAEERVDGALVTDADGRLLGIVTERDVTRRIAFRTAPDTPVSTVMTTPVHTVRDDDRLYYAVARMRRLRLRHMPVVDRSGRPVGVLRLSEALAVTTRPILDLIDALTHEESVDGLVQVKSAQVEVAASLFADNVPATEIQRLLTDINMDIHRRVVDLSLADMAEGGAKPPVPYALIVMGSGGRGENFLYPDQDNGLILGDYPDEEHDRIDGFFIDLAVRVTETLDHIGLPKCKGYVMAVNPLWRKTLGQWREQVRLWGVRQNPVAICLADIFFDFRAACGDAALADSLRESVTEMARSKHVLLKRMEAESVETRPAIGLFGRFITERNIPEHRGQISLKHSGTRPLVEAARFLALREGIAETSTLGRLDALHARGLLGDDEHEELRGAFEFVTRLLLRQQIRTFRTGGKVSNYVWPDELSGWDKRRLRHAFRTIGRFRDRVHAEFTAEIF